MKPIKVATTLSAGLFLALLVVISLLAVACSGRAGPPDAAPAVEGPALVMFYTDN
jgi:hypothetical protein